MPHSEHTVTGTTDWALWPGHAVLCVRVTVDCSQTTLPLMGLIDIENQAHELRPYRFGMFRGWR